MTEKTVQVPLGQLKQWRKDFQAFLPPGTYAVLNEMDALLTPKTDEMPVIVKGMLVRYRDGGDERVVGEFVDGAWDLIIPGTEKSRMAVEPEVFWKVVEPVPAPPHVEDMAPGTRFTAEFRGSNRRALFVKLGGKTSWPILDVESGQTATYTVGAIDLSTIRDINYPEENR